MDYEMDYMRRKPLQDGLLPALDKHEVPGSNPGWPTSKEKPPVDAGGFFRVACGP